MRSENTIKNSIIGIVTNVLSIIIGIVTQSIFLRLMGTEYLGVNSLFSNIVSMLGIVELGLGSAIVYHLYKPIAEDDKEKIKILMMFYKKCYIVISFCVAIIGCLIVPFLNKIVGEVNFNDSIYVIFSLFMFDTVMSYALTYRRSILYADQKTYIINIIHAVYLVIMNCLQIVILYSSKNYILYLVIRLICRIVENIIINIVVYNKYPYLKEKTKDKIDQKTLKDIRNKIKGLFFHKISSYIVNSTDNIIISAFLGVTYVGLYSNYHIITNALILVINQMFSSIVASIGNLCIENNQGKNFKVYKSMLFINFWISCFCTVSFYGIVQDFIVLWVGKEYLLSRMIVLSIAIVFYLQTMRKTLNSFKEANGIFYVDRYSALLEALINAITSIILVKKIGLAGVLIGTMISSIYIYIYAYPKYTYTPLFNRTRKQYLLENLKYFILLLIIGSITIILIRGIKISNVIIQILIDCIICLVIPNLLILFIFRKSEELNYTKNMIKGVIKKWKKD